MTLQHYQNHTKFPVEMVTLSRYTSTGTNLKKGDSFIAVSKKHNGGDDFSFMDQNGHPHHYSNCAFKYEE